MTGIINTDALIQQIRCEILHEMEKAAEPIIEEAVKQFRAEIRKKISAYAATTLDMHFEAAMREHEVVIVIKNEATK